MLTAKQRFATLDGLRGVAAIAVVFFHVGGWTHHSWFPRGYLAVDFFFCMSGFVMAHAYGERLSQGFRLRDFAWIRLVRLWPLIAASMLLGAAYGLAKIFVGAPGADNAAGVATCLAFGLLLVPMIWKGHQSYFGHVFPLNGPAWSLFLEIIASLSWAAMARWLSTRVLLAIIAATGLALLGTGLWHGSLETGGNVSTFWLGFPRVLFSFPLGILLYRLHAAGLNPLRGPGGLLATCLAITFAIPNIGGSAIIDPMLAAVVFPIIILAGAGQPDAPGVWGAGWRFSGAVSYPLYALHAPLWALGSGALVTFGAPLSASTAALLIALIILASWLALKLYDEPLRRRLSLGLATSRLRAQA